jgi:hypothetical protein
VAGRRHLVHQADCLTGQHAGVVGAADTAAASLPPAATPIGAERIGCSMPSICVSRVCILPSVRRTEGT